MKLAQVAMLAFLIAAAVTLWPWAGPRMNDLGYASACPFAPWSTLVMLAGAGASWIVKMYLKGS